MKKVFVTTVVALLSCFQIAFAQNDVVQVVIPQSPTSGLGRIYVHLENFVMPIIENVKDEVINRYNNSWLKEKDNYLWEKTQRYKEADIEELRRRIQKDNPLSFRERYRTPPFFKKRK